jgi:uncharacterized SAM-binding protein YcdF (DUF218 family)
MKVVLLVMCLLAVLYFSYGFLTRLIRYSQKQQASELCMSEAVDCVVVAESTAEALRCVAAWDVDSNRLVRLLPHARPLCNAKLHWSPNTFKFGERLSYHHVQVPDAPLPHRKDDIRGTVERRNTLVMGAKDVFALLVPHVSTITRGAADLGLSHSDYCEEDREGATLFAIKTASATETFMDPFGRLTWSCTDSGLDFLPVTSVTENLQGPAPVPAGSVILLSLTRGWGGLLSEYSPKRCYLMVIGILRAETAANERCLVAEVVKLSRKGGVVQQDCDTYIGRRVAHGGWDLPQSKWCNPFRVENDSKEAREAALVKYRSYVLSRPDLMESLHELRGKRLGCWCKTTPDVPCHGDVLVELLERQIALLDYE